MKYTLLLVLLTSAAYLFSSSFSFFIPNEAIYGLGFSSYNWLGALVYPFLHISPIHLISNMFMLLAVGLVVEEKLKWKDYYAIYLLSAVLSGIVFIALVPNIVLVGASAAIAGFVIPACLIDFKKTVAYLVLFSLISVAVAWPIQSSIFSLYSQSKEMSTELEQAYNQTVEQKTQIAQNISALDDKFNRGEINITDYNQSRTGLVTALDNLTEQEQAVSQKLDEATGTVLNLEEGITREQTSQTSLIVHLAGSFAGFGYLALFRRDVIWNSGYQVLRLERWLRRRLRRSRKRT